MEVPAPQLRRFREARAALSAAAEGSRYARASAIDRLIDVAALAPALGVACLRAVLTHLDGVGERVTSIEIDRARALRDRVAPSLRVGPPIDAPAPPTELELRARAALGGLVRGPVPDEAHPDHGAALALTALAHLRGGRADAALPMVRRLIATTALPEATWAVVAAASTPLLRRAMEPLVLRAAAEVTPRFAVAGLAAGFSFEPARATAMLAMRRGEPQGERVLRAVVEREALRLRANDRRAEALAILDGLERFIAG